MIFLPQPSSLSYGEGTFTIHYDSRIFLDSESPAELFLPHSLQLLFHSNLYHNAVRDNLLPLLLIWLTLSLFDASTAFAFSRSALSFAIILSSFFF